MNTVSRTYTFSAAHRLEGHPKCGRLHGHNYKVTFHVTGEIDGNTGMVIDFSDMDTFLKPLVDALDHRYIVSSSNISYNDPYTKLARDEGHSIHIGIPFSTAECLAAYFGKMAQNQLNLPVRVEVYETEKNMASWEG